MSFEDVVQQSGEEEGHLELAHVLFMDIVSYSLLPMDHQREVISELQQIVREAPEFVQARNGDGLICLPTGDGMALVFFGDPTLPVRCARHIAVSLRNHSRLKLRMGIHTGPVYRVADINANSNIAGGGINFAQRVMDCGDAGHILLSKAMAETLAQLSKWKECLHDLGEVEVKHSVRIHVFNIFSGDFGNSEIPSKLRERTPNPPDPNIGFSTSHLAKDSGVSASIPFDPRARQTPTRARYWVVVFAVTLAILSYIDRVCISQAAPIMSKDLHLSRAEMGTIFGAFALAYALFEIPGGWLGDWIGPRRVLTRIVLWWSAFTAATGLASSFWSLAVIRFLFGAGEAGCFPNLTKAFTTWLPVNERVEAQGVMWTFARWGGAFTPPLVIFVFRFMSWRSAFMLFGALGVIWAVFFFLWFRDNPRDHKSVNAAELELLQGADRLVSGHAHVPWLKLVSSRSVQLLWVQYFCLSFPWYFYITWLPTYLQEYRKLSPAVSANYAILPLLFGGLGSLFSGFISIRVTRWTGSVRLSRRILACTGFLGASLLLLLSIQLKDALWGMGAMALASFCNDLVMPPAWATCMDIGGKFAGTVSGSMNMMGNLAGFAAPVLGGYILQTTHNNWNLFLYVMAAVYLVGTLCWPFIDPEQPL